MSAQKPARFALLLLLTFACVAGLPAAAGKGATESAEIASLRAKAESGNGLAQYNLGLAYLEGRDVPIDLPEAFVWLTLASEDRGSAGKGIETVLTKISDEQLAEGRQRLAARRLAMASAPAKPTGATRAGGPVRPASGGFTLTIASTPASSDDATAKVSPVEPPPFAAKDDPGSLQQEIAALRGDKLRLANELAQTRKDLEKSRAELQVVSTELTALRASVALLENAVKSLTGKPAADQPKVAVPPTHSP
jgi:hypothetical protein